MFSDGCSYYDIGLKLNRTSSAIKQFLRRSGRIKFPRWNDDELDLLYSIVGEYPKHRIVSTYNRLALSYGLSLRSKWSIFERLKRDRKSIRINKSSSYYTAKNLSVLMGASPDTILGWFQTFNKELKPERIGDSKFSGLCVKRSRLKRFLLEHPSYLERYKMHIDMVWLVDLLTN